VGGIAEGLARRKAAGAVVVILSTEDRFLNDVGSDLGGYREGLLSFIKTTLEFVIFILHYCDALIIEKIWMYMICEALILLLDGFSLPLIFAKQIVGTAAIILADFVLDVFLTLILDSLHGFLVVLCRLRHGRGLFGLFLLGLLLLRLLLSWFFGFGLFLPEQTTEEGVKILSGDLRQSLVLRGSLEDQPAGET